MSACADKEMLLHGLLDGELDAANAQATEAHLKTCPGCAEAYRDLQALRARVAAPGIAYAAPDSLRARLEAMTAPAPASPRRLRTAAPWAVSDAPDEFVQGMLKGIIGFELTITRLQGKVKMSQNRPEADRTGVVAGLRADGRPDLADLVAQSATRASQATG